MNFYSFLQCHYWHRPEINLCLIQSWKFWQFPRKWGLSSLVLVEGTKVQSQSNTSSWLSTVRVIKCIHALIHIIIIKAHAMAKTQRRIAIIAVVVIKQDRSDAILLTVHEWILSFNWWITTQHIWCPFLPIEHVLIIGELVIMECAPDCMSNIIAGVETPFVNSVFRVNSKHLSRVFHRWPGKASKTVGIRWIAVTKVVLEHVVSPVGPSSVSVIPPKCRPLYFLTMFAFSDRRTLTSVAVILIHRNTRSTISTGFLITWTQCKV